MSLCTGGGEMVEVAVVLALSVFELQAEMNSNTHKARVIVGLVFICMMF